MKQFSLLNKVILPVFDQTNPLSFRHQMTLQSLCKQKLCFRETIFVRNSTVADIGRTTWPVKSSFDFVGNGGRILLSHYRLVDTRNESDLELSLFADVTA